MSKAMTVVLALLLAVGLAACSGGTKHSSPAAVAVVNQLEVGGTVAKFCTSVAQVGKTAAEQLFINGWVNPPPGTPPEHDIFTELLTRCK